MCDAIRNPLPLSPCPSHVLPAAALPPAPVHISKEKINLFMKGAHDEPEAQALAQTLPALVREEPEKCADLLATRLLALEI